MYPKVKQLKDKLCLFTLRENTEQGEQLLFPSCMRTRPGMPRKQLHTRAQNNPHFATRDTNNAATRGEFGPLFSREETNTVKFRAIILINTDTFNVPGIS